MTDNQIQTGMDGMQAVLDPEAGTFTDDLIQTGINGMQSVLDPEQTTEEASTFVPKVIVI